MSLTADDLNRAVDQLIAARRVLVIAGFSAFSLSHYFGLAVFIGLTILIAPGIVYARAFTGVTQLPEFIITVPDGIVSEPAEEDCDAVESGSGRTNLGRSRVSSLGLGDGAGAAAD